MEKNCDQNSVFLEPVMAPHDKAAKKNCNCRNSKCLKLYCECFSSGEYCRDCNCVDCYNIPQYESYRTKAIQSTLTRNPAAFRPKVVAARNGAHLRGCACRKSNCLKRYCECFQAGIFCSEICKCKECRNFEGCGDYSDLSPPKCKRNCGVERYREFVEQSLQNEVKLEPGDEFYCNEEVLATEDFSVSQKHFTYSVVYEACEARLFDCLRESVNKFNNE